MKSVPERPGRRRYIPLLYRVAGVNALLLVVAVAVTIVVLDPSRVSSFRVDAEGVALIVALLLVVAINVYLVRRLVGPVQALTALARRVDLGDHGERMPVARLPRRRPASSRRRSTRCSLASRPSAATPPAGCSPARRPSACGSRRSCTTRSGRS